MNNLNIYKRYTLTTLKSWQLDIDTQKAIYCLLWKNQKFITILAMSSNSYDYNINEIVLDCIQQAYVTYTELKDFKQSCQVMNSYYYKGYSRELKKNVNIDQIIQLEDTNIIDAITAIDNEMTDKQKEVIKQVYDTMQKNKDKYKKYFTSTRQKHQILDKLQKYSIFDKQLLAYNL